MEKPRKLLKRESFVGDSRRLRGLGITPQSEAISLIGDSGGFVWNRPVAVYVERGEEVFRIPIVDHTRRLQWLLWGLSLLFTFLFILRSIPKRRNSDE